MNFMRRFLRWRDGDDNHVEVVEKLEEHERIVIQQQGRIRHLERERELYRRSLRRRPT